MSITTSESAVNFNEFRLENCNAYIQENEQTDYSDVKPAH